MSARARGADGGNEADVAARIAALDWPHIGADLEASGCARIEGLLGAASCDALAGLYSEDRRFRSRVVMARHGYGQGEYKYFTYPLPGLIADLRAALYRPLVPVANQWMARMGSDVRYPDEHDAFIARCREGGQMRPTPLLLRYGVGDYNCLHQDLYGAHVFPLQAALLLSQPGRDFTGGEFVLTEQRPRMQSRCEVVPLQKGDAVIFTVHQRPRSGSRGAYRVQMRHGVSQVRSGTRVTAGIIFHDAL